MHSRSFQTELGIVIICSLSIAAIAVFVISGVGFIRWGGDPANLRQMGFVQGLVAGYLFGMFAHRVPREWRRYTGLLLVPVCFCLMAFAFELLLPEFTILSKIRRETFFLIEGVLLLAAVPFLIYSTYLWGHKLIHGNGVARAQ